MKIKVIGKAHLHGVSKKTGNDYNFIQVHYNGKSRGVDGQAALTLSLDPKEYPLETIAIGGDYNVEFDGKGYIQEFTPVPAAR